MLNFIHLLMSSRERVFPALLREYNKQMSFPTLITKIFPRANPLVNSHVNSYSPALSLPGLDASRDSYGFMNS